MLLICHSIHERLKIRNKNKELSSLLYWDANNLYGWAMSKKLLVNNFESIEDTSQFNIDFINNYNEEKDQE